MLPPMPLGSDSSPEYEEYLGLLHARFSNDPSTPEPPEVEEAREKRLQELYQILTNVDRSEWTPEEREYEALVGQYYYRAEPLPDNVAKRMLELEAHIKIETLVPFDHPIRQTE